MVGMKLRRLNFVSLFARATREIRRAHNVHGGLFVLFSKHEKNTFSLVFTWHEQKRSQIIHCGVL